MCAGACLLDWDAGMLYNQNEVLSRTYGNLDVRRVAQAVGPSFLNADGVVQCGTPDNPIPVGNGPRAIAVGPDADPEEVAEARRRAA